MMTLAHVFAETLCARMEVALSWWVAASAHLPELFYFDVGCGFLVNGVLHGDSPTWSL